MKQIAEIILATTGTVITFLIINYQNIVSGLVGIATFVYYCVLIYNLLKKKSNEKN